MSSYSGDQSRGEANMAPPEISEFIENRIIPAVDYLAGDGFVESALPGSEWDSSRRLPGSAGAVRTALTVGIFLRTNEIGDDPQRTYTIKVTNEHQTLDETEDLFQLALESGGLDPDEDMYDPDDPDEDALQAWRVKRYMFSNDPDDVIAVRETMELQDDAGNCYWSEEDLETTVARDSDGGAPLSYDEEKVLRQMADFLPKEVVRRDLMGSLAILGAIGVPDELLYSDSERAELRK